MCGRLILFEYKSSAILSKKTWRGKQRTLSTVRPHSKPGGKNGLNDQIKTSIRQALDARELIRLRSCRGIQMRISMKLRRFWKKSE